ncbi:MAG: cysteine desulfurase family protein [Phycisphaerales bacterium]
MNQVYLDHHATTRPCEACVDAMLHALQIDWGNPSSVHRMGQQAARSLELARGQVAALLGARSRDITFTGSGTEAIDLAIRGVLEATTRGSPEKNIIVSDTIEHSAVRNLCKQLGDMGRAEIVQTPIEPGGRISVDGLAGVLDEHKDRVALVSVQWANNETGVIQPVRELASVCRASGVLMHSDATQWVGKMPTDLSGGDAPELDLLSCSAHKFHGPKGAGVLWVRRGVRLIPTLPGSQELGRRAGTHALPAIAGMGAAAEAAAVWLEDRSNREAVAALRDRLESGILARCPGARVNGDTTHRLWSVTNIGFPGLSSEALLLSLSERGVFVSAGAACASGSLEPSPVLLAMGVEERVAHGSLRFSLSRETTGEEIEHTIGVVERVVAQLSRAMPG